jgi:hypothetical protein
MSMPPRSRSCSTLVNAPPHPDGSPRPGAPRVSQHPRHQRPARQRAETRQTRPRTPTRLPQPPARTPPRRGENRQTRPQHHRPQAAQRLKIKLRSFPTRGVSQTPGIVSAVVQPTWEDRDLPVLRAVVDLFEENGSGVDPESVQRITGFDGPTVARALRALRDNPDQPFFTDCANDADDTVVMVGAPTGWARRAVGLWPTPEILADRIIAVLDRAAEAEPDEAKRGRLKELARFVASSGRDLLVQMAANIVTGQ